MLKGVKPAKVGIVGCGEISEVFFQNMINRFEILEVVKCCSKSGVSARAKGEQYGVQATTLEDILSDPEIEIIANLTPAPEHYAIIKAALEAGKHVYTEKIITTDVEKTRELVALAQEKGLYFCCEPDHFLGSAWQCARELIDNGMMGQITSAYVSICQDSAGVAEHKAFVNTPGGGIGFDFGIYPVTQLVSLLGPAVEVCGMADTAFPQRVHRDIRHEAFGESYTFINEDHLMGTIRFASGPIASIHMNGNTLMTRSQFVIFGTEGILTMPNPGEFSGEVILQRMGSFEPIVMKPVHGFDHDSRGVGAAEMAWAMRQGRPARSNATLGLHSQEVLQGVVTSYQTKSFYQMTTTCTRPEPLPKGYLGKGPFAYGEEGALV